MVKIVLSLFVSGNIDNRIDVDLLLYCIFKGIKYNSMKTIKIPAPLWFQKLHEQSVKLNKQVLKDIVKEVGYAEYWCKENFPKCMTMIKNEKKKDKIYKMINKVAFIKEYAWAKFRYNFSDKMPIEKVSPAFQYKPRKKVIEIKDVGRKIDKMAKKINKNVMGKLKDLEKMIGKGNNKTNRT